MKTIDSLDDLARQCRLKRLYPFGLQITAAQWRDIRAVDGTLLIRFLRAESLLLLRGFDVLERDEFLRLCQSCPGSELLHWDFGPVMEMKEQADAKNYLFSRERVPLHWDGAFHRVPSYLVFQCLEAPSRDGGGETLFTDTTLLWRRTHVRERHRWSRIELTYSTEKLAHYGGRITVPMVQRHPRLAKTIVRYAEPVDSKLNPVALEVAGIDEDRKDGFVQRMEQRVHDPEFCYTHRWEPGDMLFADNHALIHGRNAFSHDSPRHLRRIQIL